MKIRLKNFKCHLDTEFDFGVEGLILLAGSSGKGKSSILAGISFVLYNSGRNIVSFGQKSCSVTLYLDNLVITRTRRPNRLILLNIETDEEFEDETAQGIINNLFGHDFTVTSYLQQNSLNSFILLSPTEKLEFLEKFAFQHVDLGKIKGRCGALLKKGNESLISVTSKLEVANDYFNGLVKPAHVPFPLKTVRSREKVLQAELKKVESFKGEVNALEKELSGLKENLVVYHVNQTKLASKRETLSKLLSDREVKESKKKTISYIGDDKLKKYEQSLTHILSFRELTLLKQRYEQDGQRLEEMQKNEQDAIQNELNRITGDLWQEYTLTKLNETLSEYKQYLKHSEILLLNKRKLAELNFESEELESRRVKLVNLTKTLKEAKDTLETYSCPKCGVNLTMKNNVLRESSNGGKKASLVEVQKLEKEVQVLEGEIKLLETRKHRKAELEREIKEITEQYEEELPFPEECNATIEYLQEYKRCHSELEKKKEILQKKLADKTYSKNVQILSTQLVNNQKRIILLETELRGKIIEGIDEETLRDTINKERNNREVLARMQTELVKLEAEITTYLSEIERLGELNISPNIETEVQILEEKLAEKEKVLEQNNDLIQKIKEYQEYKNKLNVYTEWKNKTGVLAEEEKTARDKYSGISMLKEKILEAESLAVANIVNSINIHAQEYLDAFFPDYPISVRLSSFKQSKKGVQKPQINVEIDYKEMDADVNMLSGGELSRVILAYTLALAEIFNSPFILLDECTASLDQELNSVVMDAIRKNFPHKLIIVIAHQVIAGEFDRQILL
jgi:DNA repair exonuclease SbcCD ATPase subunit